jgi:hypothetical protein
MRENMTNVKKKNHVAQIHFFKKQECPFSFFWTKDSYLLSALILDLRKIFSLVIVKPVLLLKKLCKDK